MPKCCLFLEPTQSNSNGPQNARYQLEKVVGRRMRGECPVAEAEAPGSGAPRILSLTVFTVNFLRFEVHFSCSVLVLRRVSISAHVWYGLQTNLSWMICSSSQILFASGSLPKSPPSYFAYFQRYPGKTAPPLTQKVFIRRR